MLRFDCDRLAQGLFCGLRLALLEKRLAKDEMSCCRSRSALERLARQLFRMLEGPFGDVKLGKRQQTLGRARPKAHALLEVGDGGVLLTCLRKVASEHLAGRSIGWISRNRRFEAR